ncbi:MAG TPA: MBL fold metallo-hydrolase [Pyrinomonadaceae bacterium]|nr:MBL fold metallo-hydrolase [Pyrinomonadaceae bacterium]
MIFKQFYLESLGHASYMVGSEQTGEALVLDVRRDVDNYFKEARAQGMRIAYAADTHQHNDYLTGICELPVRGEVQLLASARAELGYKARPLGEADRLEVGEVVFEVMQTPGHTPEHISILVTDRSRGDEPALLLSGGALLVADVARPDLLGGGEQTRMLAADMCRTLQEKILTLPDHVEVYPTHVTGSLCGGHIGSRLSTTIGYERRMNRMLAALASEKEFVENCLNLENLPAVPPYWKRMRKQNQAGPPLLGVLQEPPPLRVADFENARDRGAIVLDCRSPEAFGGAHIRGALNVGAGSSFPTWAGTVLPPDTPYILVLEAVNQLWDICWELLRIGYDLPQGWLAGGMLAWRTAAKPFETLLQWSVWDLEERIKSEKSLVIIDVRQPQEWADGHIANARHITGAELPQRIDEVPKDVPVAVICGSGYRSSVSASLLAHHSYQNIANVLGGMSAWKRAGLPTV